MRAGRSAADPPAAVAAVDRWDRQTDGRTDERTPDRYIDHALHTVRTASITQPLLETLTLTRNSNPNNLNVNPKEQPHNSKGGAENASTGKRKYGKSKYETAHFARMENASTMQTFSQIKKFGTSQVSVVHFQVGWAFFSEIT